MNHTQNKTNHLTEVSSFQISQVFLSAEKELAQDLYLSFLVCAKFEVMMF